MQRLLQSSLGFRIGIPFTLIVTAALAGLLADHTGKIIEFFPGIPQLAARPELQTSTPPRWRRKARRVVVVVVDGLALSALKHMPFLVGVGKRGAHFRATVETPAYSRTGYSALASGSGPELSGVTSNSFKGRSPVDSIFARARSAGLVTAFVGYDWWLDLYGKHIKRASVDSGGPNTAISHSATGPGFVRRLLVKESYRTVANGRWRALRDKLKLKDRFGDPRDTIANEEVLRAQEAVRVIRTARPDLLYVHLENTDFHGHESGSVDGPEYRQGAKDVDAALSAIAGALDPARDVLIVTADHGFVTSNVDAGHGGFEAAMQIPLIFYGAGVAVGKQGSASQRDVAPTVAVLLGIAFPRMNQGTPVLSALQALRPEERTAVLANLNSEQLRLANIHLAHLKQKPVAGPDWRKRYRKKLEHVRWRTRLFNLPVALLLLGLLFLVFHQARAVTAQGLLWWLLYEGLFTAVFLLKFRIYSMSMYASLGNLLTWAVPMHLGAMLLCVLFGQVLVSRAQRQGAARPGIGESVLYPVAIGTAAKAAVVFVFVGQASLIPHGFWLFAGLLTSVQTLLAAIVASVAAVVLGPSTWGRSRKA